MSFDNLNIGKKVDNFETSEVFDAYGRVDVTMGEDDEGEVITVSYPNIADDKVSGRILTVDMPMCTDSTLALTAATRIYTSLNSKDPTAFQYVPHQTDGALADPSIEFGDSTDINGVHSGFHTRTVTFGRLMKHDLTSPTEEEVDHEYPYQDSQQRQITRNVKDYKARLSVTNTAIEAEVTRATAAEGTLSSKITINANAITSEVTRAKSAESTLSSKITQNAESITAEVSRATTAEETKLNHTRTNTSFGWKLTADGFYINQNSSKNIFTATKDGITIQGNATVTGKIQATSGYIGGSSGFTIDSKAIRNTMTSLSDTSHNGVYIGTDGIALGKGKFKVTSAGVLMATSADISGKVTITSGSINLGQFTPTGQSTSKYHFTVSSAGAITVLDNAGVTRFAVSATGALTVKSNMASRDDTSSTSGMYIGTDGIALGGGNFKVTSSGAVTAKNLALTGGSITLGDNFSVTSSGAITAKSGAIGGWNITEKYLYKNGSNGGIWLDAENSQIWLGSTVLKDDGQVYTATSDGSGGYNYTSSGYMSSGVSGGVDYYGSLSSTYGTGDTFTKTCITANYLKASAQLNAPSVFFFQGSSVSLTSARVMGPDGETPIYIYYLGYSSGG